MNGQSQRKPANPDPRLASRYQSAASMSRWDEAERHFQSALQMNTCMGAWPWAAHTQHQHGAMLLAQGQPGDRERAAALLNDALETASRLGMKSLADKVEDLSRQFNL